MIGKELLQLLRCPESGQGLALASEAIWGEFEAARGAGRLWDRGGRKVEAVIEGGLVREDGEVFYPICGGIPLLGPEDAVRMGERKE
ncbi:MAG: Trm112 family protein [Verrucomicrobiota bacterium]